MPHSAHPAPSPRHARIGLAIHAAVYGAVNAMLVVVNLWSGDDYWFQWPLLGWGAGLAFHAWTVASRVGLWRDLRDHDASPAMSGDQDQVHARSAH